MKLSVVILNYNVRYFLELCLKSVEAAIQDIDAEIIVVDNDSKDGSCDMVKALFPEVKLIANKKNYGFSKGNNIGVLKALEEHNIPIDYITGTSAGALVGAMYASGYSPLEIESFVTSEKFWLMSQGELEEEYEKRN